MINAKQIQEILSLYTRHGWKLRRVLLTEKLKTHLADSIENLFAPAKIIDSEIDAIWLSRTSAKDSEAWEIRRLSETPYALFESFDDSDEEETREETRKDMEARLQGKS